jgi:phosphatidate cytidylyltransferase
MTLAAVCVLAFLVLETLTRRGVATRLRSETGMKVLGVWRSRSVGWWTMAVVFGVAMLTRGAGSIVFFALLSLLLLRELITATPTKIEDHRILCWSFFVVLPLHYMMLAFNWYGLFIILIPVYAFLLVPTMVAVSGNLDDFLGRVARIQWSLMLAVYCVSHAPAILMLRMEGGRLPNAPALLFLVLVVQARESVAAFVNALPRTHPALRLGAGWRMSWEGEAAGYAAALAAAWLVRPLTPFSVTQALALATAASAMCAAAALCLAGLRSDWGRHASVVIERHGSVMERALSLCFAAPLFFHLVRFFCGGMTRVGFH